MQSPRKRSFAAEQLARQKRSSTRTTLLIIILALIVVIVGAGIYIRSRKQAETNPIQEPIRSIAVLPFDNLSDDEEDEYFSDGITDDIIFRLQQIRTLKVISRTTYVQYWSSDKSLLEIGKELDVTTILGGTVRRAGDRVKITVQLIDAQTDSHLWGGQYEKNLDDIFTLQGEIAQAVVEQLKVTLLDEEKVAIEKKPTDNIDAYELYMLGNHWFYKGWGMYID